VTRAAAPTCQKATEKYALHSWVQACNGVRNLNTIHLHLQQVWVNSASIRDGELPPLHVANVQRV
jgi:hypothetical protein